MKSDLTVSLDHIQSVAHEFLRPLGYRKRGRTHNKRLDSGLVHVINFQMGQYPIGGSPEILPYRPNLYGSFTINLGVFIPEVHTVTRGLEPPAFVQEYDCEIRQRLGSLVGGPAETWWSLVDSTAEMSARIVRLLGDRGLPYLGQFLSRQDIINHWERHGPTIGLPPRAGLTVAIMLASMGQSERAQELLQQEYEKKRPKGYPEFVKEIAKRIGLLLVA